MAPSRAARGRSRARTRPAGPCTHLPGGRREAGARMGVLCGEPALAPPFRWPEGAIARTLCRAAREPSPPRHQGHVGRNSTRPGSCSAERTDRRALSRRAHRGREEALRAASRRCTCTSRRSRGGRHDGPRASSGVGSQPGRRPASRHRSSSTRSQDVGPASPGSGASRRRGLRRRAGDARTPWAPSRASWAGQGSVFFHSGGWGAGEVKASTPTRSMLSVAFATDGATRSRCTRRSRSSSRSPSGTCARARCATRSCARKRARTRSTP